MPSEPHDGAAAGLFVAMRGVMFALILLTPLPFGSVQAGAVFAIQIAAALLGVATAWAGFRSPGAFSRRARVALIPATALLLVGVAQLLPRLGSLFPGSGANAGLRRDVFDLLPETVGTALSFAPPDTLDALLRLTALVLIGLAASVAFRTPNHYRQAALVIVVSGTLQAVYGSMEYLSGHQHIFSYAKKYYLEDATGTFINRNHFAGYLAMTLPFAIGLLLPSMAASVSRAGWRERVIRLFQASNVLRLFAGVAVFCVWAGITLSYSRAGLLLGILGVLIVALAALRQRRVIWPVLAVLVIPTAFLMVQDLRAPGERLVDLGDEVASESGRLAVRRATTPLATQHPIAGTGLGTFDGLFPTVQPPGVKLRFRHAHNDWLQAALEGGLLSVAALLSLLWITGRVTRGSPFPPGASTVLRRCATASIVVIACHSLIDFSLRIPAIAVLLAVIAGLQCSPDPDVAERLSE